MRLNPQENFKILVASRRGCGILKKKEVTLMKTQKPIECKLLGTGSTLIIPMGTRCDPAHNIPSDNGKKYWVKPSRKMNKETRDQLRCTGLLLTVNEIKNGI